MGTFPGPWRPWRPINTGKYTVGHISRHPRPAARITAAGPWPRSVAVTVARVGHIGHRRTCDAATAGLARVHYVHARYGRGRSRAESATPAGSHWPRAPWTYTRPIVAHGTSHTSAAWSEPRALPLPSCPPFDEFISGRPHWLYCLRPRGFRRRQDSRPPWDPCATSVCLLSISVVCARGTDPRLPRPSAATTYTRSARDQPGWWLEPSRPRLAFTSREQAPLVVGRAPSRWV